MLSEPVNCEQSEPPYCTVYTLHRSISIYKFSHLNQNYILNILPNHNSIVTSYL